MSSDNSVPTPAPVVVSETRLVGRVKWFNNKSGFGFITPCEGDDKDIFVHYTCLCVNKDDYKYLVQGEYVEFDLVKTADEKHEFHAANVSGIKGGLLMCQTHTLNNNAARSFVPRGPPRRTPVVEGGGVAPSYAGAVAASSSAVPQVEGGFTEVKRRGGGGPRKRVAGVAPR